MRYEAHAFGTREEIIDKANDTLMGHRGVRRQQEALDAIAKLEAGADAVMFGHTLYHVEEVTDEQP